MKRLTINRIAGAGLRSNRRSYLSLTAGIFLSVFIISSLCLCIQGVIRAGQEQLAKKLGYEDCMLINSFQGRDVLEETGFFDQIGTIYVMGSINGSAKHIGYYDETAARLMNRSCAEGRLPENPGEIAIERSVLENLQIEAEVGGQVTWTIHPIDGEPEERTFTVVGLLNEQTAYLDISRNAASGEGTVHLPSALVCAQEPNFSTGWLVTHYAMTLKPTAYLGQVYAYEDKQMEQGLMGFSGHLVGIDASGPVFWTNGPGMKVTDQAVQTAVLFGLLGASLALAACIGISSAMEGQLSRKREEIGMLRAVGATRRQIRRVFGRESWLLALMVSPVAVAAGCLFCWALSRLAPEQILFEPTPLILIPVLLLSMVCILLSSSLPLRRASRIMPMSVLRDTTLLRRAKKVTSRAHFVPHRLIALRQNRLYPTRQVGATLLVTLMLLCALLTSSALMVELGDDYYSTLPDLALSSGGITYSSTFYDDSSLRLLSPQDLAQIAALPGVDRVNICYRLSANTVHEKIPAINHEEPFRFGVPYLLTEEEYQAKALEEFAYAVDLTYYHNTCAEHDAVRDLLGVSREKYLLKEDITVCAVDPLALQPYVTEGKVNLEALNAGAEMLAFMPDYYEVLREDGTSLLYSNEPSYMERSWKITQVIENDTYYAGQQVELYQLYSTDVDLLDGYSPSDDPYARYSDKYASMERRDATVTIGAVLKGKIPDSVLRNMYNPCLITTPQGLEAMGLTPTQLYSADVYLQDGLAPEDEDYIAEQIATIAMRGDQVYVNNYIESAREDKEYVRNLLMVLGGMALLFFSVSVSMITGNLSRRLRADARMIGTLRAVGADEKVISACYNAQVTLSILVGLVLGTGIWIALHDTIDFPLNTLYVSIPTGIAFSALCLLCCRLILRLRIREIMGHSIVENIREM